MARHCLVFAIVHLLSSYFREFWALNSKGEWCMKINQLIVKKLHGYIDIDLQFNEDLTILVGVNGSGKTSALILVAALLRLDARTVFRYQFESLRLNMESPIGGEVILSVSSKKEDRNFVLKWRGKDHNIMGSRSSYAWRASEVMNIFSSDEGVRLKVGGGAQDAAWLEILESSGKSSSAEKLTRNATREFLSESKLTFVQLDRSILAVAPDGTESFERQGSRAASNVKAIEPIDEIARVTKRKFLEYKAATERIRDEAYKKTLELHFASITSAIQGSEESDQESFERKLSDMRRRVMNSALTVDEPDLKNRATTFFSEFERLYQTGVKRKVDKRVGRRTLDEEQLDAILNLKRKQIEGLVKIFEDEAGQSHLEYSKISKYLEVVSRFFKEGGKRILFGKDYELGFEHQSHPGVVRPLKELSSGERQILIILTYLAFVSGEDSIFVIDEPELSLHLVWQGLLVGAVKDLRPAGCQIVLATHAPEIAGRARDNCVRLGTRWLK